MKQFIFALTVIISFLTACHIFAIDALEIVRKGDEVVNAPKDAHIFSTMVLIDKNGQKNVRTSEMYQKGTEKRLIRFLSPADQKGIGFLTLPNDIMYLYLPAFHKVRQIASHVKNQSFAGTDLTYEDLSEFELSKAQKVELIQEKEDVYIIKLSPKETKGKDYTHLFIYYRKDNYYPVKVEFYDNTGNVWKTIERKNLEKVKGYWIAKKLEVKDFKKEHATISTMDKVDFDVGLKDDIFTKRYLMRSR